MDNGAKDYANTWFKESEGVESKIRDAVSKGAMKIAGYNRSRMESDKPNPFLKGIHLPLRSETMLRILAAAASGLADYRELISAARNEYRLALRRVDELRAEAEDPIRSLLVESASLQLDADLRWLDVAEQELRNFQSPLPKNSKGVRR